MKQHRDLCWAREDARRPCDCPTPHKWKVVRRTTEYGTFTGWIASNGVHTSTHGTWWAAYTRATLNAEREIAEHPCYCDLPHYICIPCGMWARGVGDARRMH